jgi:hypothetical protein
MSLRFQALRNLLAGWLLTGQLLSGGVPPPPPPLETATPVVLTNGSFEAGLLGWTTWQEDTGKPAQAGELDYAVAPTFSPERNPLLVHGGAASLHVGHIYDPWHAGLKQTVPVTPGARVRFCIFGRLYASNRDFGHEASWSALDGRLQVGLYADGEAEWNASGIVWSEPANPHDEWRQLCVETAAGASGRITIFTSANYRGFAAKHLDAWWDDASLAVVSQPSAVLPATAPLRVLLLVPSAAITSSAYVVMPANLYVGAQGVLTLSLTTGASLTQPMVITLPPVRPALTPTAASTPVPSPTASPMSAPATPTLTPTAASTSVPTSEARPAQVPLATLRVSDQLPVARSDAVLPVGSFVGLGVLLMLGLGLAVALVRRR